MPLTVLWDMDGTLVDSEPLHDEALTKALRSHGVEPPPDFHARIVGRDAETVHAFCRDELGIETELTEWLRIKYGFYMDLLTGLPSRDGAVELFHEVAARGGRQAIVSNSDRLVVSANLDTAGLSSPRQVTVSRNDVKRGKPDSEPYDRAAYLMGVPAAECIVVEDSRTGAGAGIAAGCRTLFWPQLDLETPEGAERVHTVDDLRRTLFAEL